MKIKKGDTIIVITGKDAGKTAKVTRAFPKLNKVLVEGVNVKKKHERARQKDKKGTIVSIEHPIHVSNVMHIDPKTGKGTRKISKK